MVVQALSGGADLPPPSVLADLADAPQSPASTVNWAGARLLQIELRDGVRVSLQVVPDGRNGLVRITGDAVRPGKAQGLARAFRRLSGKALHVSEASATALLGDLRESLPSTNISTITGAGGKREQVLPAKKNM